MAKEKFNRLLEILKNKDDMFITDALINVLKYESVNDASVSTEDMLELAISCLHERKRVRDVRLKSVENFYMTPKSQEAFEEDIQFECAKFDLMVELICLSVADKM